MILEPVRCIFSALLPSQERKDLLLFLVASDFFSSSVIAGVGAVEHLSNLCAVFSLQLYFSLQQGLLSLILPSSSVGHVCLSLILIIM